MTAQHYYRRVIGRLSNCFQFSHYVVASGKDVADTTTKTAFPAVAEPVHRLGDLTCERALQVHVPVIGAHSQSVLMPIDIEVYMGDAHFQLYENAAAQHSLFLQSLPLIRFAEKLFRSKGMPYLLDYTPSGAHLLFQNRLGYRATEAVRSIGALEEDLIAACRYTDPSDIRRREGVSLEAARVFSGLGRLAEYVALQAMAVFKGNESEGRLPVVISDVKDRCLNFDNSWSEGSPFMRCIRSPFSLHRKNQEIYRRTDQPPLVDVVGAYFDGNAANEETDMDVIGRCMWNLDQAANHACRFTGYIPCSNETLIDFIEEYKKTDLYLWHQDFDRQGDLAPGAAIVAARRESRIGERTRATLDNPNPAALQPKKMIDLVHDFLINACWDGRHIANILRDLYKTPAYNWGQDFSRYPADEKANFWVRTFGAVTLWKTGKLNVPHARSAD